MPPAVSVHVVGLKLPPTPPAVPKVTTPPVTTPAEPLSVEVTVMPVVEANGAEAALTVETLGATAAPNPVSERACDTEEPLRLLSVRLAVPVSVPVDVGANVTARPHEEPAVMMDVPVQVVPAPMRL